MRLADALNLRCVQRVELIFAVPMLDSYALGMLPLNVQGDPSRVVRFGAGMF